MNNNNHISVKARNASFLAKGILWLMLMLLSLACAMLPVFTSLSGGTAVALSAVGGVAFVASTAMFVMLIVREVRPIDALVLDQRGFRENLHLLGADVEWTNVAEVGIYGTKKSPMFGITLENNDIVLDRLRKRAAEEMRDNIEENLPSILIAQSEIKMPLNELRELFNRFIREARTLEGTATVKQKSNPFTTDDVLRAFGKLPNDNSAKPQNDGTDIKIPDDIKTKAEPANDADGEDEDFYARMLRMAEKGDNSAPAEPEKAVEPSVPDTAEPIAETAKKAVDESSAYDSGDMPEEFRAILNRPRSGRIAEIERMLDDPSIPFSASRNNPAPEDTETMPDIPAEKTDKDGADTVSIQEEQADAPNVEEKDGKNGKLLFEDLTKPKKEVDNADTGEIYIPSITEQIENIEPSDDDDDDIIIPPADDTEEKKNDRKFKLKAFELPTNKNGNNDTNDYPDILIVDQDY